MENSIFDLDFNKIDEEKVLEELLNKRIAQLVGNKQYKNLMDVFRNRFDTFEKLIYVYKANKKLTLDTGDTAYNDIKTALKLMGYIQNESDITNALIGTYLNKIRVEKKSNKYKRKSSKPIEQSSSENSTQHSAYVDEPNQVEVKPIYTREKDWHDVSWLDTEPTDWSVFHAPTNRRPQSNEWNDYWENVWRWLYKNGKADYKMNSQDLQWYAGFKKAMGSDFADLWLDLQKVRGSDKNKELNLNTKGVGKA
jgi:hypothetical protein